MRPLMHTLLATDAIAQNCGCKLKPALRAAIEADARFPVHAASPTINVRPTLDELPENVLSLEPVLGLK